MVCSASGQRTKPRGGFVRARKACAGHGCRAGVWSQKSRRLRSDGEECRLSAPRGTGDAERKADRLGDLVGHLSGLNPEFAPVDAEIGAQNKQVALHLGIADAGAEFAGQIGEAHWNDEFPGDTLDRQRPADFREQLRALPAGFESAVSGFQWLELRRMTVVLVMPATHPLAPLKKIAPARLRDLPLIGLGRENFPEYVAGMRTILKPFGVVPRFVSLVNDGVSALFVALEASNAATLLADGIMCVMPRPLVARPFSPALPDIAVKVGLPAVRPNPHAETFARLLREAAGRAKCTRDAEARSA